MKQKLVGWFYRNFINISFPKLNMISLWGMLIFTVIFTWLTIQEEHKVFEKNFFKDAQAYAVNHQKEMALTTARMRQLMEWEMAEGDLGSHNALERIAAIFSADETLSVNLYAPDGRRIFGTVDPGADAGLPDRCPAKIVERDVRIGAEAHYAILTCEKLDRGYTLVSASPIVRPETLLQEQTRELRRRLTRIILEFATLAFIIFGFMLGINTIYNGLLKRDVKSFMTFFKNSARRESVLNPNMIFFSEFKKMVEYANEMVTALASHKRSLETLNLSLEDKVKRKTAALEVKNFALEEEKAFSQNLLRAQKQFIRYAIHETNTPLSVIMANIDLYTMKYGKNVYLSKIDASVKNLFNIYDDLAYLVKKDQVEYPKKQIDLCLFVQSRLDFFSEVAEQAGLSFAFEGCETHVLIRFNETKLQRIVDNNLTNAIKYTLKHETIRVGVKPEGDDLVFSIASRSQLIEDTEKVFDAFYRERSTAEGLGLGLNLVKSICSEEGVGIELTSDETMTCFTYRFEREDESITA